MQFQRSTSVPPPPKSPSQPETILKQRNEDPSLIQTLLQRIESLENDTSFYQETIRSLLRETKFPAPTAPNAIGNSAAISGLPLATQSHPVLQAKTGTPTTIPKPPSNPLPVKEGNALAPPSQQSRQQQQRRNGRNMWNNLMRKQTLKKSTEL